jgi:CheY-like chemotaxis protein
LLQAVSASDARFRADVVGVLIGVIEPDSLTLQLMSEMLESEGFRTLPLSEVAGAVAIIKEKHPDLLVLEPGGESVGAGWTLLESIRSDEDTRELPVIVCTSDVAGVQKRTPILSGPPETSVLIKPFDPQALVAEIREALARRETE